MRRVLFSLAIGVVGCASAPPKAETPPQAAPSLTSAQAQAPAADALPTHTLHRADVHRVVAAGLGAFLQHVTLDDHPVMLQGKFHGFRVASFPDALLHDVDLKPGDVITRVNGFSIEHPEEALEAFRSLEVASELRVDYERNGAPRELRYAIVDP